MRDVRFELAGSGGSDGAGAGIGNVDEREDPTAGAGERSDEKRDVLDEVESRFILSAVWVGRGCCATLS